MGIGNVAMLGVAGTLLAVCLRQHKQEYGLYIGLGCTVCILLLSVERLSFAMDFFEKMQELVTVNDRYVKALVKMLGITYVAEFASGICQDAGYSSVGKQIEIFGKFSIIALSMPVLFVLLETLEGLLP